VFSNAQLAGIAIALGWANSGAAPFVDNPAAYCIANTGVQAVVTGVVEEASPIVVQEYTTAVRTLACVVTYEPDRAKLLGLVRELGEAPSLRVVFIDNSETEAGIRTTDEVAQAMGVAIVRGASNQGVAAAYNVAVDVARRAGCDRLLLADQDSRIPADSIASLQAALDFLQATGRKVAAVGPSFVDPRSGRMAPFVRLGRGVRMRHVELGDQSIVECDLIISSGSLIPLAAFDEVGLHDESLFIDYVDVEWCARARTAGFGVYGVPAAVMYHSVGDGSVRRLGRWMPLHSPPRQYYAARNALLFARKPYLPWKWRMHLITRAMAQFAIYAGTCAPRWQRARWLALGLVHGLVGRSGRLADRRRAAPARPRARTLVHDDTASAEPTRLPGITPG
jgi:rhamnosyltransferase